MVKTRHITSILILFSIAAPLFAQSYDSNDTVTEYPCKGTFYHDLFEGRKTYSGEIFAQNKFTAAHWKIKIGTLVLVTNSNTGKQVIVRINDRCPKRGVLDMSHRSATAIGIRGCQPVSIRLLPNNETYIQQWKAQDNAFDTVSISPRKRPRRNHPSDSTSTRKQHQK